jgi:hypothetical protein
LEKEKRRARYGDDGKALSTTILVALSTISIFWDDFVVTPVPPSSSQSAAETESHTPGAMSFLACFIVIQTEVP